MAGCTTQTTTTAAAPETTTTTKPTAPGVWTNLSPAGEAPSPRCAFGMVYDPDLGRTVVFGGSDDTTDFNDTWSYSHKATGA